MLPWRPSEAPPAAAAQPPAPITLASTLFFLQGEHRRYNRDRNEWEIERAEMRARLALLEGEKRGNEGAIRDLSRRCKMLESALRNERSKFLSSATAPNHSPSPSGTSSPLQVPHPLPLKHKEGSPPLATASLPPTRAPSAPQTNGGPLPSNNIGGGTQSSLAPGPAQARDPRGRARSRDYLKQCLQEITYLTSSSTLNPLSSTSYSAPSLVRPRKILSDYPAPPPSAIPLHSTAPPMVNSLNPASQAGLFSLTNTNNGAYNTSSINGPRPTGEVASNYPSDPASVFVPLTRQGSNQGARGSSIRAIELEAERPDAAEREREGREAREAREGAGTTTSFMAVKPPPPSPPATPAPPTPNQSTPPDVPLQLSEPPEEEDDDDDDDEEEDGGETTMEATDAISDVNSIDDDDPPPSLGESGRRGSQSARGSIPSSDLLNSLRMPMSISRNESDTTTDWSAISELPSLPTPPPSGLAVDDIDEGDAPPAPVLRDSESDYLGAFSRGDSIMGDGTSSRRRLPMMRDFSRHLGMGMGEDSSMGNFRSHRDDFFSDRLARPEGDDDDLDHVGGDGDGEGDDDAAEATAEAEGKSGTGLVWENAAGELSEREGDVDEVEGEAREEEGDVRGQEGEPDEADAGDVESID